MAQEAHSDPNRVWIEEVPQQLNEVYFHNLINYISFYFKKKSNNVKKPFSKNKKKMFCFWNPLEKSCWASRTVGNPSCLHHKKYSHLFFFQ